MNILSLFDGAGISKYCFQKAGIPVKQYFASEVDKYAMQISLKNNPDIIQLGDIKNVKAENLPKIDFFIGGSPCQGFSFAGKQLNFEDERSKLFFEFVRLVKECKPKYFLLENVKMKKEYQDVISDLLGVGSIEINSALVSAQNRKRLYWTNIPSIQQPEDRGILLKDIIEDRDVDRRQLVFGAAMRGRHLDEEGNRKDIKGAPTQQRIEATFTEKSNCLSTVQKDTLILLLKKVNPRIQGVTINADGIRPHQGDKRKSGVSEFGRIKTNLNCKSGAIINSHQDKLLLDELTWRKLTPLECERLQTWPDNYTEGVSNAQRYRMLGNGFTAEVIIHILKYIY